MKIVIDIPEEVYNNMVVKNEYTEMDVIAVHNALMGAKRMPEKFADELDCPYGFVYMVGWNDCLDEILGGEEE